MPSRPSPHPSTSTPHPEEDSSICYPEAAPLHIQARLASHMSPEPGQSTSLRSQPPMRDPSVWRPEGANHTSSGQASPRAPPWVTRRRKQIPLSPFDGERDGERGPFAGDALATVPPLNAPPRQDSRLAQPSSCRILVRPSKRVTRYLRQRLHSLHFTHIETPVVILDPLRLRHVARAR